MDSEYCIRKVFLVPSKLRSTLAAFGVSASLYCSAFTVCTGLTKSLRKAVFHVTMHGKGFSDFHRNFDVETSFQFNAKIGKWASINIEHSASVFALLKRFLKEVR